MQVESATDIATWGVNGTTSISLTVYSLRKEGENRVRNKGRKKNKKTVIVGYS